MGNNTTNQVLRWSKTRPTTCGWYFFRCRLLTSNIAKVVQVLQLEGSSISHVVFSVRDRLRLVDLPNTSEFAGPIPLPLEAES